MGAEQSDMNSNQYIIKRLKNEIAEYAKGCIPKDSLKYHFFLMNANNYIKLEHFFINVDIYKVADYINDLGIIDTNEAKLIVRQIIQTSNCDEDATFKLRIVLPKMRIKLNDNYISPSYSQDLFKQIFSNSYKTKWGNYYPNDVIDWKSPDITENYLIQCKETSQEIMQKKQQLCFYIKEKDPNQNIERIRYLTYPVLHSEDLGSVIVMNHVRCLLDIQCQNFQGIPPFKKNIIRPKNWEQNIHKAAFYGNESSVIYCLHLLPILLNCPDVNGNTPAHTAAMGDQPNMIKLLYTLGADFTIKNKEGHLPHQISNGKNTVLTFNSLGFDLNERDSNGESLLEIKTRDFNMDVIDTLLNLNMNIFEPNPNGTYWMQLAIHGEFYKKQMDFITFQRKVRKIISKNLKKEIDKNNIIKEILNRNVNNCDEEDTIDLNKSVIKRDINRIKILLAFGSHADRIREDGRTNLMICAERNDFEIAEILLSNFCDPNFKNDRGENIFWIASYLKNTDIALLLHDYGANINDISKSGNTILHVAYEEKRFDLFYFLLNSNCDPNVKNKNKESVLFQAFYNKDDEIAECIQNKYNGNINTTTVDDNSLAHIALLEQDLERIDYYIKRGIDIEIKNCYGYSIFMISIVMFDNLQFSSTLLKYGADINTKDLNGNTALLNILHSKKFNKCKFDFLINNNCDVNIQNSMREFPISICIIRELNDAAQSLLEKGCKINDNKSEFEPIVNALKINSQYWFETLIDNGATASNEKFPVLSTYIKCNFFNFEIMKKIKQINAVIGAPIQVALSSNYHEVALYIWEISNEQMRFDIASMTDSFGMIPISAAIVYNCKELVNILLCENYEIMKPDLQNRTPFSYVCQANQDEWINCIYQRITLENANIIDKNGNCAFTYLANNNNKKFCKLLFINNIEIFNINSDKNGIINAYRSLLNKYEEFRKIAYFNYIEAKKILDYCNDMVSYYEIEINRGKYRLLTGSDMKSGNSNDAISFVHYLFYFNTIDVSNEEVCLNHIKNEHTKAVAKRNKFTIIFNKYKTKYVKIISLTRKDLLDNFHLCQKLAKYDNDLGLTFKNDQHKNFDIDVFIQKISSIIEP